MSDGSFRVVGLLSILGTNRISEPGAPLVAFTVAAGRKSRSEKLTREWPSSSRSRLHNEPPDGAIAALGERVPGITLSRGRRPHLRRDAVPMIHSSGLHDYESWLSWG